MKSEHIRADIDRCKKDIEKKEDRVSELKNKLDMMDEQYGQGLTLMRQSEYVLDATRTSAGRMEDLAGQGVSIAASFAQQMRDVQHDPRTLACFDELQMNLDDFKKQSLNVTDELEQEQASLSRLNDTLSVMQADYLRQLENEAEEKQDQNETSQEEDKSEGDAV